LPQHGLNLIEKVVDQGFGVFEHIWPAGIVLGPWPMIPRVRLPLKLLDRASSNPRAHPVAFTECVHSSG
jgi:hypothetical protein